MSGNKFARVLKRCAFNRLKCQTQIESEAQRAMNNSLPKLLDLNFAKKKSYRESHSKARSRKSKINDISHSDTKCVSSPTPSLVSSNSLENYYSSKKTTKKDEDRNGKDEDKLPTLLDSKHMPLLHSIILGSLPEHYTLEDVHKLVEEINPIGFSEVELTRSRKLRFCQIYLRNEEDVSYVLKKLDNFIICGRKLIAVEPSALLSRQIWNI